MANGSDLKWSVGIITCPRDRIYIDQCLSSLTKAGFSNLVVFAEPGSFVPQTGASVVARRKRYGDWTNWATGLYELLLSEPDSDYFLMVEDDAIVTKDSKRYLEWALPQLGAFGTLSLYTPSIYQQYDFRGFHNEMRGSRTWSTVTVAMSREKAISFFSEPLVQRHRFEDIFGFGDKHWDCSLTEPRNSIKDAVIGLWAEKNDFPIYFHTPSLAEHLGETSSISNRQATIENGRKSADFVGLDADLSSWMEKPLKVRRNAKVPLY